MKGLLIQVRQAKLGRTNSGRSYIVKKSTFGADNVQPDETYANTLGLWIGDYVDVVKEAAAKYGARLIDLNADSGLYPLFDSHVMYFHNGSTDRLHPNNAGHERMARAIERGFRAFALRTGDFSDEYMPFYKVMPLRCHAFRVSRMSGVGSCTA